MCIRDRGVEEDQIAGLEFVLGDGNALLRDFGGVAGQLQAQRTFGGNSPDTGFDCSGLVTYTAARSLGLKLPRNAAEIAQHGISVAKNELKAGDLVFLSLLHISFRLVGIDLGRIGGGFLRGVSTTRQTRDARRQRQQTQTAVCLARG